MTKLILGKALDGEVGAWIAPPGGDADDKSSRLLLSSNHDMLRVYASSVVTSTGVYQGGGSLAHNYLHEVTINYTEPFDYIPLALFSRSVSAGEPFQFPPELTGCFPIFYGSEGPGYNAMIILRHDKLFCRVFTSAVSMTFNYVVFYNKLYNRMI